MRGIDYWKKMIATRKDEQIIVFQICRNGNNVELKELEELYSRMSIPNGTYDVPANGYFISNIPYSDEAIEFAGQKGIVLLNGIGELERL